MSAQSLQSYLSQVRDRGMPLFDSWRTRHGRDTKPKYCPYEVSAIQPLREITSDDLVYYLAAAVNDTRATHLHLHVFAWGCEDPDEILSGFYHGLKANGFIPMEIDITPDNNGSTEYVLILSLFSEYEGYTAHDLFH